MRLANCVLLCSSLLFSHAAAAAELPQRWVSSGGSLSEWVVRLGGEGRLVGVDTTSLHPQSLRQLPSVGYQRALSAEGVLSLRPDILIGSEEMGPPPVVAQIAAAGVRVESLSAKPDLATLEHNVLRLGERRALLKDILESAIPVTMQDVVLVFVTVSGLRGGSLVQEVFARKIFAERDGAQPQSASFAARGGSAPSRGRGGSAPAGGRGGFTSAPVPAAYGGSAPAPSGGRGGGNGGKLLGGGAACLLCAQSYLGPSNTQTKAIHHDFSP